MTISINHTALINGGGMSIQSPALTRTGSGGITLNETIPVSKAGSLTTRTDADTGTVTMADTNHGITSGTVVDVYFSGGVHYGATVGTVSGTSVPIDSGTGDNLPVADSDVTVVPQTSVNILIDGDNVKLLAASLESVDRSLRTAGHVQFLDASNNEIAEIDFVANAPIVWDIEGGSTNPFAGAPITKARISQGGAVAGQVYSFKMIGVQDASP